MLKKIFICIFILHIIYCFEIVCSAASFSNSEVLQTISDYYSLGIENYTIQTGYSNSYTTYSDFASQLNDYKYFMVEYLVTSNSSYLYIYYGDQMWYDSNLNRVSVKNARSGQFIIYENFQGGKSQKSVLRNIVSYSNSQFNLDTTTQKYYIFNCATSVSYNDYYAKQGGFSGDEIFNIKNENGQSTINTNSSMFDPSYSYMSNLVYQNGYKTLYVKKLNRPPSQWLIGKIYGFDVNNESLPPLWGEFSSSGKNLLFSFNTYSSYNDWSSSEQSIYINSYDVKYNSIYYFSFPKGGVYEDFFFLFQPLNSQAAITNISGDFVFSSGDGVGPTTEEYLADLSNGSFNYSGDNLAYLTDNEFFLSGDVASPFYFDLVKKLYLNLTYSGDAVLYIPVYNNSGDIDHYIDIHSSQADWHVPILSEYMSLLWVIGFGLANFIWLKTLYDDLTSR